MLGSKQFRLSNGANCSSLFVICNRNCGSVTWWYTVNLIALFILGMFLVVPIQTVLIEKSSSVISWYHDARPHRRASVSLLFFKSSPAQVVLLQLGWLWPPVPSRSVVGLLALPPCFDDLLGSRRTASCCRSRSSQHVDGQSGPW